MTRTAKAKLPYRSDCCCDRYDVEVSQRIARRCTTMQHRWGRRSTIRVNWELCVRDEDTDTLFGDDEDCENVANLSLHGSLSQTICFGIFRSHWVSKHDFKVIGMRSSTAASREATSSREDVLMTSQFARAGHEMSAPPPPPLPPPPTFSSSPDAKDCKAKPR